MGSNTILDIAMANCDAYQYIAINTLLNLLHLAKLLYSDFYDMCLN